MKSGKKAVGASLRISSSGIASRTNINISARLRAIVLAAMLVTVAPTALAQKEDLVTAEEWGLEYASKLLEVMEAGQDWVVAGEWAASQIQAGFNRAQAMGDWAEGAEWAKQATQLAEEARDRTELCLDHAGFWDEVAGRQVRDAEMFMYMAEVARSTAILAIATADAMLLDPVAAPALAAGRNAAERADGLAAEAKDSADRAKLEAARAERAKDVALSVLELMQAALQWAHQEGPSTEGWAVMSAGRDAVRGIVMAGGTATAAADRAELATDSANLAALYAERAGAFADDAAEAVRKAQR